MRNRDSSVGVVTRLRCGRPSFDSWQVQEIFVFSIYSRPALGSNQPPIQWALAARFLRVKRQGREADHSPPSNVKNFGAIPPLRHMPAWHSVTDLAPYRHLNPLMREYMYVL
jgi:hypothetical protein